MKVNNKLICSALAGAVLFSSGQSFAATDSSSIDFSVVYAPVAELSGTAFSAPTQPTVEQLADEIPVEVGDINISSNTTNCSFSISTANDFQLRNGSDLLATYRLVVEANNGTTVGVFDISNQGSSVNQCDVFNLLLIQATAGSFDVNAPAATYTDTATVTIANQ